MKSKTSVILLTIVGTLCISSTVLLVVAALGVGFYSYEKKNDVTPDKSDAVQSADEDDSDKEDPDQDDSDTDDLAPASPAEEDVVDSSGGTIEGSVSYPSSFIPDDLTVCATNSQLFTDICTYVIIQDVRFTYGFGYSLKVPAGDYHVYAYIPGEPYNAYYSEFVTCGLSVECSSHTPIIVSVDNGELVENIDPGDWYAP